ncbi:ABC transporter substrate-binding protein [Paenibacillus agilis]|uniref:Extracellular solute-binding protein n=1 Tax=Paenibacillus agilis TaxID=3020863 RepID=A0A559IKT6_9BACL|nr:extracellular solute-binding protein [Paenibacillus agilis]TVX88282.1 extracellular solute-binding protein [Paenibacillus agilis]
MEQVRLSYRYVLTALIICFFVLLLSGCARTEQVSTWPREHKAQGNEPIPQEITIWAYSENYTELVESFEKNNQGVNVHIKRVNYHDHVNLYREALVSGNAPDIMEVDHMFLGEFSVIDGLVDLKGGEFLEDRLKNTMSIPLLKAAHSLDNERLFALPISTSPLLTYYRKDIMEKYGYPSEPEELAKYMESKERLLAMAMRLRQEGIYIMQDVFNPLDWAESANPLFDNMYMFNRNNIHIARAFELSQQLKESDLALNVPLRTKAGQEAIRSGQQAMVYLGTWGERRLEKIAPDTKGLWRATRLPLGTYGFSDGTYFMIPKMSNNKKLAWEFMKYAYENMDQDGIVAAHLPSRLQLLEQNSASAFLGGQHANELYVKLTNHIVEYRPSPFDVDMEEKYRAKRQQAVDNDEKPYEALSSIEYAINAEVRQSRKILLDMMSVRR